EPPRGLFSSSGRGRRGAPLFDGRAERERHREDAARNLLQAQARPERGARRARTDRVRRDRGCADRAPGRRLRRQAFLSISEVPMARSRRSFGHAALVALTLTLAGAAPARADGDADASIEKARQLFTEGTEHVQKAEWAVALASFEQSAALKPHAITTYNIG